MPRFIFVNNPEPESDIIDVDYVDITEEKKKELENKEENKEENKDNT